MVLIPTKFLHHYTIAKGIEKDENLLHQKLKFRENVIAGF
jgi:hypothetical protein